MSRPKFGLRALSASVPLVLFEAARDARLHFSEGQGSPTKWLALLPGYPASNHVLPTLATGDFGVLLYGAFDRPGSRAASVDALRGLHPSRVLQVIRPERGFTRSLIVATRLADKVLRRIRKHPPPIPVPTGKLASIDVIRAVLADHRCRELEGRFEKVFFPHASLATHAVVDAAMQRRGATTYEIVHGALAESETMRAEGRSFVTHQVFRTRAEGGLGGYLSEIPKFPRANVPPKRVLILSNYATQPLHMSGHLPRLRYQHDLFACLPDGFDYTWRPHPYDDAHAVAQTLRDHSHVKRAAGSLNDNIAAADAVISSISSVLVEVALADRPLAVHTPPIHDPEDIPALMPQTFTTRAELVDFFAHISGPDMRLRQVLFGNEPPKLLLDL